MNRCSILFLGIIVLLLASCRSKDKKAHMDTENTWFDYQISGEEGDDNLTVKLQFKNGWEEGDAFSVDEPGKVVFDGQQLIADSAKMIGAFYEVNRPIDSFGGKHNIVFIDFNKNEFKE